MSPYRLTLRALFALEAFAAVQGIRYYIRNPQG